MSFPPVRWLRLADSTNNVARDWASRGAPHGALVLAAAQSAGRGRLGGRLWHSPPGLGLYASWILRPSGLRAADAPALALDAARAVLSVLDSFGVPDLALKPPNDVFARGRKIAGILLEPRAAPSGELDFAVLGIGINALHDLSDFPPSLRDTATSCRLCGVPIPPDALVSALSRALFPFREKKSK